MLPDDLLELPAIVRQIAEAQAATERRVGALAEAQAETSRQLAALTQQVSELVELTGVMRRDLNRVMNDVAELQGSDLERRYREHAPAYFGPLLRKLRVLDPGRLADLLDDAVDEGRLTEAERNDVLLANLVLTGQRRDTQKQANLVVEVSAHIDRHDVERAASRAAALQKLGTPSIAAVAGHRISPDALEVASQQGVRRVLDDRAAPQVS